MNKTYAPGALQLVVLILALMLLALMLPVEQIIDFYKSVWACMLRLPVGVRGILCVLPGAVAGGLALAASDRRV